MLRRRSAVAITDDIRDLALDRVIVAACTPSLHETTFRKAVMRAGMNPYLFLPANIREQVSWAHPHDAEAATDKAIAARACGGRASRVCCSRSIRSVSTPSTASSSSGGGVAGLRAALDTAAMGQAVTLIETLALPGWPRHGAGHASIPRTSPRRPCVRRLIDAVRADERIEVRTSTRLVDRVSGYLGDFSRHAAQRATRRGCRS